MPKLIFMHRDFAGQSYELIIEKTTVGRADQNTLVLRHETVSSHHCEVLFNGPEIIVRDLDSRNGTFVDGARVKGQQQVKSGQRIRFGEIEARLELDKGSSDDWSTEETAIHLHQKLVREARSQNNKAPVSPAAKLGDGAGSGEDNTILVPAPREVPRSPVVEQTPSATKKSSSGRLLLVAGAFVVVLALVWWFATRH